MKKCIIILITLLIVSTAIFPASASEPIGWLNVDGEYLPLSYGANTYNVTATTATIGFTTFSSRLASATIQSSVPLSYGATYIEANAFTLEETTSTSIQRTGQSFALADTMSDGSIALKYQGYLTPTFDTTDLLGVWVFDTTQPIDSSMFASGYGTFSVGGTLSTESDTFAFDSIRWSYTSSGVNLVVDGIDDLFADTPLVTNDVYQFSDITLTIDSAPDGEPGRLTAFLLSNAVDTTSSGTWTITVNVPNSTPSSALTNWWNNLSGTWHDSDISVGESFTSYITTALNGFFGFEIAPGWSFGSVVSILLALVLFSLLMKVFFGG